MTPTDLTFYLDIWYCSDSFYGGGNPGIIGLAIFMGIGFILGALYPKKATSAEGRLLAKLLPDVVILNIYRVTFSIFALIALYVVLSNISCAYL
jgi:hypothetical protein